MSGDYDTDRILEIAGEMYNKKRYSRSAYLAYVALCEFEKNDCKSGVDAAVVILQFALHGLEKCYETRLNLKPDCIKAIKVINTILMYYNFSNLREVLNETCGRDSTTLEGVVLNGRENREMFSLN